MESLPASLPSRGKERSNSGIQMCAVRRRGALRPSSQAPEHASEQVKGESAMNYRVIASRGAIVTAAMWAALLAPVPGFGQSGVAAVEKAAAALAPKGWTPPRTPDGQPDLQGIWTNGFITPLERPADLAGKP